MSYITFKFIIENPDNIYYNGMVSRYFNAILGKEQVRDSFPTVNDYNIKFPDGTSGRAIVYKIKDNIAHYKLVE